MLLANEEVRAVVRLRVAALLTRKHFPEFDIEHR
jgi:hypothetical protein